MLGVLGFGLAWIPTAGVVIGLVLGILAVIFAGVGLAADTRPRAIAAAGLVLGAATLVLTLIPGLHGL